MTQMDVITRSREQFEAFNTGDWAAFRQHLAPDIVYQEIGTGMRVEGIDAYVEACRAWKAALPDLRGQVTRRVFENNNLAEEVTWEGTHTGPITLPGGQSLPPSGRTVRTEGVMWTSLDEQGRLREIRHHLDVMSLLVQIGALPQPTAAH